MELQYSNLSFIGFQIYHSRITDTINWIIITWESLPILHNIMEELEYLYKNNEESHMYIVIHHFLLSFFEVMDKAYKTIDAFYNMWINIIFL